MANFAILLLLPACGGPPEREVHVVTGETTHADEDGDDTGDTDETVLGCGSDGTDTDGAAGPTVDVEWCARVTPEAEFTDRVDGDTDLPPELPDTGASLAVPPPCGFVNLVGSLSFAGSPSDPALLYCDSDRDGGTRFVHYASSSGHVTTNMLASQDCQAEPATGALAATADGYLAVWAGSGGPGEEGAAPGVITAELDADGNIVSGPDYISAGRGAWKLSVVEGDAPLVLVNDSDLDLWAIPIDAADMAPGDAVEVALTVRSVVAARFGGSVRVAACENDTTLHLLDLDGTGAAATDTIVDGAVCGWATQPTFAVGDGVLALAWDDGVNGTFVLYDDTGAEIAREALGAFAQQPQVVWTGDTFLVLTTDGALTAFTPEGDAVGTWWHQGFVDAEGGPQTARLLYGDGRLVYGLLGTDSYPIGGGHINTFNYFEISGSAVPTL
jgi:hypothetical protein